MQSDAPLSLQAELERLRQRVAELEHALEAHEWGVQLFHESSVPQLLVDLESGAILAVNAAAQQFYGDVVREGHIDCLSAEGLVWSRDLREVVRQCRYGVRMLRQYTARGTVRLVEAHYTLAQLRGRMVVHLFCLDVTDRERAQQELKLGHDCYQAFIKLSNEAIYRAMLTEPVPVQLPVARQAELIYERAYLAECNPAFAQLVGMSLHEIVGNPLRSVCPLPKHELIDLMRQFVLAGYSLRDVLLRLPLPDGQERFFVFNFRGIVREGLLLGAWSVLHDMTELIQAQRALQESEARYRLFVQLANEGIWRFEARNPIPTDLPVEEQIERIWQEGYLAECNQAFARMYGLESPEAIVGALLVKLFPPDNPENREMIRAFVMNNYRVEGHVSRERAIDGTERYFLNSFVGVVEDGKLVRAWGVQTDITELRRLQQQLMQAYRLESIGRIAGGIAHDFNNVLTAIVGFAELARGRVQDETTLRYIDGILQAAERAANLNRQLLAYARRQTVQLVPVNLGNWLEGALELLQRVLPESIRLHTEVASNLWTVRADTNLLMQIVLNLVVNARDAMPNGGVITIRLRNETVDQTRTNQVPEGEYVTLSVADTGTGIPEEVLPYIFEPFFSTKPPGQGTGMGLAAVQGAVQQLGGYIEVHTKVGEGTCFTVYFPRFRVEAATHKHDGQS